MTPWLVLQLADSAFPVGGFAHSSGLEAAVQSGWVRDVRSIENFCVDCVRQAGAFSLPFVRASHRDLGKPIPFTMISSTSADSAMSGFTAWSASISSSHQTA